MYLYYIPLPNKKGLFKEALSEFCGIIIFLRRSYDINRTGRVGRHL